MAPAAAAALLIEVHIADLSKMCTVLWHLQYISSPIPSLFAIAAIKKFANLDSSVVFRWKWSTLFYYLIRAY